MRTLFLAFDFTAFMQENFIHCLLLGAIALIIVLIFVALIVLTVKAKKLRKAAETAASEEASSPEMPVEMSAEANDEAPSEEATLNSEPFVETANETPVSEEDPVKTEEYAEEAPKIESVPAAASSAAPASAAGGKWVISANGSRYGFTLYAPNGQVMLESATSYANLASAKSGIKTYQENIAAGRFEVVTHKNGNFQVQILNARGGLLAMSSVYSTRSAAESARDSIKRWAQTETQEVREDE